MAWIRTMELDTTGGSLCIYGGDVETIGYRPKRYSYESNASGVEWSRVGEALKNLDDIGISQVLPSDLLGLFPKPTTINSVSSTKYPIPTKKQPKYNPLRWAVGGRDSVLINTKCQQIYEWLSSLPCPESKYWEELLELWASDFRTHITENRWKDWHLREENLRTAIDMPVDPREIHKTEEPSNAFSISEIEKEIETRKKDRKRKHIVDTWATVTRSLRNDFASKSRLLM
jgi:hypothetical protein